MMNLATIRRLLAETEGEQEILEGYLEAGCGTGFVSSRPKRRGNSIHPTD